MQTTSAGAPGHGKGCVFATAAALLLLACGGVERSQPPAEARRTAAPSKAEVLAQACGGSGAHDVHTFAEGCTLCHPCGGTFGIAPHTFPGGTSTAGAQIVRNPGEPASCLVACHNMNGQNQPVSWAAQGPLACSSCHAQGAPAQAGIATTHFDGSTEPVGNRAACQSCHLLTQHLSGTINLQGPSGVISFPRGTPGEVGAVCTACHDGTGRTLLGSTPPVLVGYASPAGDFHGVRPGTTFNGGTLAAPYYRGMGPLPCISCHDAHSSTNAYLFTASAAGAPVPAATIDTAGVGAEGLCNTCHLGDHHGTCTACHGHDPAPAGQPCFYCHGHQGISNFTMPTLRGPHTSSIGCSHCHATWYPALEYAPPSISNVAVKDASASAATIAWDTNEKATSWVQYGAGDLPDSAGSAALVFHHEVRLTGLSEQTTYQFRLRSADAFRNVREQAGGSFTTGAVNAPSTPVLVHQNGRVVYGSPVPVTLAWNPSISPLGNGVQYRVQISMSPGFETLVFDSAWLSGTSTTLGLDAPEEGMGAYWYYWRAMARDSSLDLRSAWSAVDAFYLYRYDPYDG